MPPQRRLTLGQRSVPLGVQVLESGSPRLPGPARIGTRTWQALAPHFPSCVSPSKLLTLPETLILYLQNELFRRKNEIM